MKRFIRIKSVFSVFLVFSVSFVYAADSTVDLAKKHFSFGVQQKKAGNNDEARRQFEKSIASCDSLYQVQYVYGELLVEMDDSESAKKAFERALELKPDYYNAAAQLAKLRYEAGDYEGTLKMYSLMYDLKPENKKLLVSMTSIREYLGDDDGAYTDLKLLIDSGQDSYDNLMRAAAFALNKNEYENAHMYAVLALGKKKDDIAALELAGKTGRLMEDNDKAIRYYRRLAEVDSTSIETITILSELYRTTSDRGNLIWALKRHHNLVPDNVEILGELCELFFPEGLTEEGVEFVRKGLKLAPEDGRFHILMGENYRALGQEQKALEEYKKALKDERWNANAQRLIWQIDRPESEEEMAERKFFNRGK